MFSLGFSVFSPKERFFVENTVSPWKAQLQLRALRRCGPCSDARHQVRGIDSLSTDLCVAYRPAIPGSLPARRSGCPANFEYCEVAGDGTCRSHSHIPLTYPTHKSRRFGLTGKSPAPAPAGGAVEAHDDIAVPPLDHLAKEDISAR